MIVLERRRNERIHAIHNGVRLIINVCKVSTDQHKTTLGFEGPHEVYREELLTDPHCRRPVVHLAGPLVRVDRWSFQRCLLCGYPFLEEETDQSITYIHGQWYRVADGQAEAIGSNIAHATEFTLRDLPPNCCLVQEH